MKALGIVLIVAGVVAFAMPVAKFLLEEKPADSAAREAAANKIDLISFAPLLGVTFLAVGGAMLVAGAITGKK
jgi:hypothetical protein